MQAFKKECFHANIAKIFLLLRNTSGGCFWMCMGQKLPTINSVNKSKSSVYCCRMIWIKLYKNELSVWNLYGVLLISIFAIKSTVFVNISWYFEVFSLVIYLWNKNNDIFWSILNLSFYQRYDEYQSSSPIVSQISDFVNNLCYK